MTWATVVYGLCALTALLCAWLLLTAYHRSRYRLLLWSGLCFVGLTVNNVLLVIDKLLLPDVDLSLLRSGAGLVAMLLLMYGLVLKAD
jgi:hydrogenase/urease accessory protein HupE